MLTFGQKIEDRQQYQRAKLARTAQDKILEWYNIDTNGQTLSQLADSTTANNQGQANTEESGRLCSKISKQVHALLKHDRLLHPIVEGKVRLDFVIGQP